MSGYRGRIEILLGQPFRRPGLFDEALRHRSAANEGRGRGRLQGPAGHGSNERLEFIGDRVLGLLMAEWLIERFPDEQEGSLAGRHAHLVSRPVLARIAVELGVSEALDVAPHEARAGVREAPSVLADAVEALLGAAYLDGGLEPARRFVRAAWRQVIDGQGDAPPKDPKTALQEWVLGRGMRLPTYVLEAADGPPHAPLFSIRAEAAGRSASGSAGSKRAAESAAAAALLEQLR